MTLVTRKLSWAQSDNNVLLHAMIWNAYCYTISHTTLETKGRQYTVYTVRYVVFDSEIAYIMTSSHHKSIWTQFNISLESHLYFDCSPGSHLVSLWKLMQTFKKKKKKILVSAAWDQCSWHERTIKTWERKHKTWRDNIWQIWGVKTRMSVYESLSIVNVTYHLWCCVLWLQHWGTAWMNYYWPLIELLDRTKTKVVCKDIK